MEELSVYDQEDGMNSDPMGNYNSGDGFWTFWKRKGCIVKGLLILAVILVLIAIFHSRNRSLVIFHSRDIITEETEIDINRKLEKIEDSVRLAIIDGELHKALDLTNQLVHPYHMQMPNYTTQNVYGKECSDLYYDGFWDLKRAAYKEKIVELLEKNPGSR